MGILETIKFFWEYSGVVGKGIVLGIIFAIVIVVVRVMIIVIKKLLTFAANNYIKRKRERLFDINLDLAKECKKTYIRIFDQSSLYNQYISDMGLNRTHNCSSLVVANAQTKPIKFLMKYSNLNTENAWSDLERFDFCIAHMKLLETFRENISQLYEEVRLAVPAYVRRFASTQKSPFVICGLDSKSAAIKNLTFTFLYISPAGTSSREHQIEITSDVLKSIQMETASKLNKSGHARTQRSAMTNDLREAIKKRDNYTCCICGNSSLKEPNLLLEVDHIIPVSRGGKTEATNLQTLCWRCNRTKSDK